MIVLDVPLMVRRKIPTYRSAAWSILIPHVVAVRYIKWVQVLPQGLTIYNDDLQARRAGQDRIDETGQTDISCICCGAKWRLGTWVCPSCWEPPTFRAIHDTFPRLSKVEVVDDIKARYNLTMKHIDVLSSRKTPTLSASAPGQLSVSKHIYRRPLLLGYLRRRGPRGLHMLLLRCAPKHKRTSSHALPTLRQLRRRRRQGNAPYRQGSHIRRSKP